ncbi:MAG: LapA family protein [Anaerolineae bacterium]|nr:LapA family protein [Anaerolineae bacterium]
MAILIIILFLALLVAIATVILALYNSEIITVSFLAWSFQSSLAVLLLTSFGAGGLVGWLITLPSSIKKSLTISGNKKKIENLEKQLSSKTYNLPKVDDEVIQSTNTPSEP